MNAIENILTRRSIRQYKNNEVSKDDLNLILKAGMFAPSARNQQPWHFIVVTDREKLSALSEIHPYAKMLMEAPVAILVCADESVETSKGYWPVDCSNATQNILLSSHALGLGSVWLGVYPREERMQAMKNYFNLPENISPFSLIAIGYANELIDQPERFIAERIHKESW